MNQRLCLCGKLLLNVEWLGGDMCRSQLDPYVLNNIQHDVYENIDMTVTWGYRYDRCIKVLFGYNFDRGLIEN